MYDYSMKGDERTGYDRWTERDDNVVIGQPSVLLRYVLWETFSIRWMWKCLVFLVSLLGFVRDLLITMQILKTELISAPLL